jgi:spermidine synthase
VVRRRRVALALGATGVTSAVGQILLLRELMAVLYGNELVLSLALAAWLAWVAAGSWSAGRLTARVDAAQAARLLAGTILAAGGALPAQLAAVRLARELLGITPGVLLSLGAMMGMILLLVAPLCLLLGAAFALGARVLVVEGGSAGAAYAAESAGAVVGGTLLGLVLIRWVNPFQIAMGMAAVTATAAAMLAGRARWLPTALLTGLLAIALPVGAWLHDATLAAQYPGLRFAGDSIYGRVVVTGAGEQRVFYENGLLLFETQGSAAEEIAHLPLLAHPAPRRVLLIGGGVGGTLGEILRQPGVETVHYVELDPLLVTAARQELPPGQAAALDDPRATVAHVDGRRYVRQLAGVDEFDAIILDLPEPSTGQLSRFYTVEFFAEVDQLLAPGGLVALSLPWQENYVDPASRRLAASIYRSLSARLSHVVPIPGDRLFLLASDEVPEVDAGVLAQRLAERGLDTRWVVPSYLAYHLADERISRARALLEGDQGAQTNRDLVPVAYFYDLTTWLSRLRADLGARLAGVRPGHLAWLAAGLAAAVVAFRRWRPVAGVVVVAGGAGMMLQVALLLGLQVVHGYVYGLVTFLVTAYMGGLVVGSWAAAHRLRPQEARRDLQIVMGALAILGLLAALLVGISPPAGVFLLLALIAGTLGGLVFPLAVGHARGEGARPGTIVGSLYAADLAGACAGAVLAAVLVVPLLGIPGTCLAVGSLGLAGMALLL